MLGLIKKDIMLMKHQFHARDILIMACLILFLTRLGNYTMFFLAAICLVVVSGYCNTLATCDLKSRWNEYESVLPIAVRKRVAARYIGSIGMLILMLALLLGVNVIISFYSRGIPFNIIILLFYGAYLHMMIALPISLKSGGEKASYVTVVFLAILAVISWRMKDLDVFIGSLIHLISSALGFNLLLIVIVSVVTVISYRLSVKNKSNLI